jgi:very-short-patch-repair endonuclease
MANIYDSKLKEHARMLRKCMTKQEIILWNRLRGRQVLGIKFLRQKPFGNYILDFYAPQIKNYERQRDIRGIRSQETKRI